MPRVEPLPLYEGRPVNIAVLYWNRRNATWRPERIGQRDARMRGIASVVDIGGASEQLQVESTGIGADTTDIILNGHSRRVGGGGGVVRQFNVRRSENAPDNGMSPSKLAWMLAPAFREIKGPFRVWLAVCYSGGVVAFDANDHAVEESEGCHQSFRAELIECGVDERLVQVFGFKRLFSMRFKQDHKKLIDRINDPNSTIKVRSPWATVATKVAV